jgi:predicted esterase
MRTLRTHSSHSIITTPKKLSTLVVSLLHLFSLPISTTRGFSSLTMSSSSPSTTTLKPRLLCLHGKYQSGATFSNKIAGARRKLARVYDLHFLDGPIRLNQDREDEEPAFAWWHKDEHGVHSRVEEGMDYVLQHMQQHSYDGIVGFSQGGVLATALCCSGQIPSCRVVVTAGAPMVEEAFLVAKQWQASTAGYQVPKLHLAGETDAMISVPSTTALCQRGGNGTLILHDQGHLFPTRALRVQQVLDFLEQHLLLKDEHP